MAVSTIDLADFIFIETCPHEYYGQFNDEEGN